MAWGGLEFGGAAAEERLPFRRRGDLGIAGETEGVVGGGRSKEDRHDAALAQRWKWNWIREGKWATQRRLAFGPSLRATYGCLRRVAVRPSREGKVVVCQLTCWATVLWHIGVH